jgi:cytochrome P450
VNASVRQIIPPAPRPPSLDLSSWRMLRALASNSLTIWPDYAYETMIARRDVFGVDNLLINHLDGIRHVLITNAAAYRRATPRLRPTAQLDGERSSFREPKDWTPRQGDALSQFNAKNDGSHIRHFQRAADRLLSRIEKMPIASLSATFADATLDATLRALFSERLEDQSDRFVGSMRDYIAERSGAPSPGAARRKKHVFIRIAGAGRQLRDNCLAMVDAHIATRAESSEHDLLAFLLAARHSPSGLPDEEIRDLCGSLLVAGAEATSRLLLWSTYLLTLDLSEQERIRAEVAAFPVDKVATADDLLNWPRSRQTLMEALRLYPPEAYLTREAIDGDVLLGEEVRPRTMIWISPWLLHRHRRFWDNPTAFTPDRFSGRSISWNGGGAFIPFGVAPRGGVKGFVLAEAQILLAALLSRYEIGLGDTRAILPAAGPAISPNIEPNFILKRI